MRYALVNIVYYWDHFAVSECGKRLFEGTREQCEAWAKAHGYLRSGASEWIKYL